MARHPGDNPDAEGAPPAAPSTEPVFVTRVAPPPRYQPRPVSSTHFVTTSECVDESVPYLKFTRIDVSSVGVDPAGPFGDSGVWSDLAPDQVKRIPVSDSPDRALWDISREEAQTTLVDGPVTVGDGQIRARLGEIGITRQEWECVDPDTRRVIKEFLRAEADLIETVIAATIVRDDGGAREIQRKAKRYLQEVTADLGRRSTATTNPLGAIRRDRAWHDAQPLLERLTELLADIADSTKEHDLVADEEWVAEQVARVNSLLTTLARGRYYAYCTPELLATLKVRSARQLALEITHYFHRDVTVDDLRRSDPPRQRSTRDAAGVGPSE